MTNIIDFQAVKEAKEQAEALGYLSSMLQEGTIDIEMFQEAVAVVMSGGDLPDNDNNPEG